MALYVEHFSIPNIENRRAYPYHLFASKRFHSVDFEPVTIFYGSNGSGKSTLLNIIARKLKLEMKDRGNDALALQPFIDACSYKASVRLKNRHSVVPDESRFIRSEDVMHNIVRSRKKNESVKEFVKEKHPELYERFFNNPTGDVGYVWSDDRWIYDTLSDFFEGRSNGELALEYFQDEIFPDSLVLLDEPENSMSPKFQSELAKMLSDYARYLNCQFVIATHSPFLLAIPGAKIYDLDSTPTTVKRWTELENMKLYAELFKNFK